MFSAKLFGAGNRNVRPESLTGGYVRDLAVERATYVDLNFESDGTITTDGGAGYTETIATNWHSGTPTGGDYEIQAVLDSGDTPSGAALNTWHNLATQVNWGMDTPLPGVGFTNKQCSLTITLRVVTGSLVVASDTYELRAQSTAA